MGIVYYEGRTLRVVSGHGAQLRWTREDFHLFKRRGRKISGGVQATPLGELQQGLGVWVEAFHTK
jgi:hypothetical protein